MDSVNVFNVLKLILASNNVRRAYLISSDELHLIRFNKFPIVVILHSRPKAIKEGHWLSLFIDRVHGKTIVDYWDSYGLDLDRYKIRNKTIF
jgi:hypothetical protein